MTAVSDTYLWRKQWRIDYEHGLTRMVDAAPTTERVRALVHAGWSIRAIADAAGASYTVLSAAYRGKKRWIIRGTAAAVLAVQVRDMIARSRPADFVPNVGTKRRLQALLANGWTHPELHERSGLRTSVLITQPGKWVTRRTHDAIVALYEDLWDLPGPSDVTRKRARRLGYVPPLSWDDDEIDDPSAAPYQPQESRARSRDEIVAEARRLADQPFSIAAARIGISPQTLDRALCRAGQYELARRLRDNNPPRPSQKEWTA